MTEDRDLLPWILGGLSMAAIAMAIAVGLTGRTTPARASSQATSSVASLATAELTPKIPISTAPANIASPSNTSSSAALGSLLPTPAQGPATEQTPPGPAPNPPGNQIWECTTNGVKTFSNNRCGNTAILRDVGPINVMDASPVASNVHWYGSESNDTPDYSYPDPPQSAGNSYPAVVGVPYLVRRRPEHPHQPTHHDRGHPRRN